MTESSTPDTLEELSAEALEDGIFDGLTWLFPSDDKFQAAINSHDMADDEERQRKLCEEERKLREEESARKVKEANDLARKLAEDLWELQAKELEDVRKYNPVKLDFKEKDRLHSGVNYDVWAIRMKGFLLEAGLWGHVSGTETRPHYSRSIHLGSNAPLESPEQHKWDLLDLRAQSVIRSGLSENMVLSTSSATSSKEIWETLELVYKSHDTMTKMQSNTRFYSLKMREHEPIDQFVG